MILVLRYFIRFVCADNYRGITASVMKRLDKKTGAGESFKITLDMFKNGKEKCHINTNYTTESLL